MQLFYGLISVSDGMINTVIGDISNESTQSLVFSRIPVFSFSGDMLGLILGGVLAFPSDPFTGMLDKNEFVKKFPYVLSMPIQQV